MGLNHPHQTWLQHLLIKKEESIVTTGSDPIRMLIGHSLSLVVRTIAAHFIRIPLFMGCGAGVCQFV
jgi:hypothetical protein